ncbi:hypothetical protein UREG_01729 [Uncinocarpus reesii 1704]|uniref:Uncharacterized protein n=1 Tax=Uncinocarpus reesii (strain UAMH 1704) TaxID=336963 RepID=C4JJC2_UNCRE|nr:uncharacterized protein UREG_01729 [Uncinocarpus reesii 1704]EEP76880.1 hypothetical protein UREG_01729 [Uncinocarpus reesii 1704]
MRPTKSENENDHVSNALRGSVVRSGGSPGGVTGGIHIGKRRNVSNAGQSCSPGSTNGGEDVDGQEEKKKPPVKRACNECRQQKVNLPVQLWFHKRQKMY